MISFVGNRPALQIGRHQVIDYDTTWLDAALHRAAIAADHTDFPYIAEIRGGIFQYLETKCPLRLLLLEDLFERVRKMLIKIGCQPIADQLRPLAPPVTISLIPVATEAGNGFELVFYESLRLELDGLRKAGAEKIHFTGLRETALILRNTNKWDRRCEITHREISDFLKKWERCPLES